MGADPLTAGLLIGGAAIQIYGQRQANKEQARANRMNALEYQEQKRISQLAANREADIFLSDSEALFGDQVTGIAKAGVNVGGSALMALATTKAAMRREYEAILTGAKARASMFDTASREANRTAGRIGGSGYNNLQTFGTVLNTSSAYMQMSRRAKYDEHFERVHGIS